MTKLNPISHYSSNGHSRNSADNMLIDNWGRRINYVRLSVTDRCNLRCTYCMPEKGIRFLPKSEILSYEEMERLLRILASMGIDKVRITGGEPFVRRDLIKFLWKIRAIEGLHKISITTNGVMTARYLPELKEMGIASINLSLDTVDRERFHQITRRDNFDNVMACFHKILQYDIPLKINTVIMEELNTDDIIPLSRLSRDYPVDVRFIEEMPFNGVNGGKRTLKWNYERIFSELAQEYPGIQQEPTLPTSTSINYRIPGHQGKIGIIAGFSRTFCGTCNRIRITAKGNLQTCLYGDGLLNLKTLLRGDATSEDIKSVFRHSIGNRFKDGWEAEANRAEKREVSASMSAIGG